MIKSSISDALDGGQAAVQHRSAQRDEALGAQIQRRRLEWRPEHLRRIPRMCSGVLIIIGFRRDDS
jgi:hypothetical protein